MYFLSEFEAKTIKKKAPNNFNASGKKSLPLAFWGLCLANSNDLKVNEKIYPNYRRAAPAQLIQRVMW